MNPSFSAQPPLIQMESPNAYGQSQRAIQLLDAMRTPETPGKHPTFVGFGGYPSFTPPEPKTQALMQKDHVTPLSRATWSILFRRRFPDCRHLLNEGPYDGVSWDDRTTSRPSRWERSTGCCQPEYVHGHGARGQIPRATTGPAARAVPLRPDWEHGEETHPLRQSPSVMQRMRMASMRLMSLL